MSYDVFVSHDRRDRAVAEAACAAIERAGHVCWIAARDIPSGGERDEAAIDAIRGSKIFLLILSSHSAVGRLLEGGEGAPLRPLTAPPGPMPASRRPAPHWLSIALAGLAGLVAIAAAAFRGAQ